MKDGKLEVGDVIYVAEVRGETDRQVIRRKILVDLVGARTALTASGLRFRRDVVNGCEAHLSGYSDPTVRYLVETKELTEQYEHDKLATEMDCVDWLDLPAEKLRAVLAILEAPDGN